MPLSYSGNAYGPRGVIWGSGINGVDRNLLYPAIRAVAANPIGMARSCLTQTYRNLTAAHADKASHASPRLFIHGGGALGNLLDEFHNMAGRDARIVIITSALDDPNEK